MRGHPAAVPARLGRIEVWRANPPPARRRTGVIHFFHHLHLRLVNYGGFTGIHHGENSLGGENSSMFHQRLEFFGKACLAIERLSRMSHLRLRRPGYGRRFKGMALDAGWMALDAAGVEHRRQDLLACCASVCRMRTSSVQRWLKSLASPSEADRWGANALLRGRHAARHPGDVP